MHRTAEHEALGGCRTHNTHLNPKRNTVDGYMYGSIEPELLKRDPSIHLPIYTSLKKNVAHLVTTHGIPPVEKRLHGKASIRVDD
jgi:hypothetical protein